MYLNLNILGVLELLALEVPGDLRLGVAGEHGLETASHPLLQPHLLDFTDEFRRLLRS
jgi:hypothetical protein